MYRFGSMLGLCGTTSLAPGSGTTAVLYRYMQWSVFYKVAPTVAHAQFSQKRLQIQFRVFCSEFVASFLKPFFFFFFFLFPAFLRFSQIFLGFRSSWLKFAIKVQVATGTTSSTTSSSSPPQLVQGHIDLYEKLNVHPTTYIYIAVQPSFRLYTSDFFK